MSYFMTSDLLKKYVSGLPKTPGVYEFKDGNSNDIYVGKALNLKNRVGFYLKTEDIRIKKMLELARSLKFTNTPSDIEALILESRLIKKLRPKFNIVMRDDKQYLHVGITADDFPKIFLTHQLKTRYYSLTADYIGPFTDANVLKSTLRFLRRIFPYCTCLATRDPAQRDKRGHHNFCLNYHIGKCVGYCCLKKPAINDQQLTTIKKEYRKNIFAIKYILEGRRVSLIKKLERDMNHLAKNGEFEKAIELRDKIKNLKRVFENGRIVKNQNHYDIMKYHSGRGELENLKKIFGLSKIPYRIEGYDISDIQGTNPTGSMVVFQNGQPDKNGYRKFKIRNRIKNAATTAMSIYHDRGILTSHQQHQQGDTGMLKEMLTRRFNHPEWRFPDLIFIDGGKGQLNAAKFVIDNLGLNIPIISLAKGKDEIFSTQLAKPISMFALPIPVQNLIRHIDSEAHRFAISYYRKLHRRLLK